MFDFFKKQKGLGANFDDRPEEAKALDYKFEEIVSSVDPVNWIEKKPETWRKFPIFDQNGSGSCVAQTFVKLLGILYWLANGVYVHFSATHVYQRRVNKPEGGMGGEDVFKIGQKGVTLEELVPSQKMTDSQMDSISIADYKVKVGEIFKIGNYVMLPIRDIDTVASVIQKTGKGLMTWFYFTYPEWTTEPYIINPNLELRASSTCRHSVACVDFTLYKGKKAIIIDDSWGTSYGQKGQRVITEDFFKSRNWFVAYPIAFKFSEKADPNRPKYSFTRNVNFSPVFFKDADVVILQNILKYEGLFPTNVDSTGYLGAITRKAIMAWQLKNGIPQTGNLDDNTRVKLNEQYA